MSKRTKVAPCMTAFFIDTTMGPAISLAQVHTMRAELRALLRVARAAERVKCCLADGSRCPRTTVLRDALASLDRASGGER